MQEYEIIFVRRVTEYARASVTAESREEATRRAVELQGSGELEAYSDEVDDGWRWDSIEEEP